jgi:hypothetical protein
LQDEAMLRTVRLFYLLAQWQGLTPKDEFQDCLKAHADSLFDACRPEGAFTDPIQYRFLCHVVINELLELPLYLKSLSSDEQIKLDVVNDATSILATRYEKDFQFVVEELRAAKLSGSELRRAQAETETLVEQLRKCDSTLRLDLVGLLDPAVALEDVLSSKAETKRHQYRGSVTTMAASLRLPAGPADEEVAESAEVQFKGKGRFVPVSS